MVYLCKMMKVRNLIKNVFVLYLVDRLRAGWISQGSFCNLLASFCALKMTKLRFVSKA